MAGRAKEMKMQTVDDIKPCYPLFREEDYKVSLKNKQDLFEERFIKVTGRTNHAQISLTGQHAHATAKFIERGFVDRLYRHAQRHAEDDGE